MTPTEGVGDCGFISILASAKQLPLNLVGRVPEAERTTRITSLRKAVVDWVCMKENTKSTGGQELSKDAFQALLRVHT